MISRDSFLPLCMVVALALSAGGCRPPGSIPDEVIREASGRAVEILRPRDYDPIGSGLLLNREGMVLTCEHILSLYLNPKQNKAREVIVRLGDLEGPASLVRSEPNVDLALLQWRPPGETSGELPGMDDLLQRKERWAPRREIRSGAPAVLVGSPYGLTGSVLTGSIAHTNRINTDNDFRDIPFIQTSGMSYPGSSGAAVYLDDGRIIGINRATWGWSPGTGIGLVVPSGYVQAFLSTLEPQ